MKITYILVAYLVLHILVFTSYVPTPKLTEVGKLLAASQWFVPTLLLAILVPRVSKVLTPILRVRFWTAAGLVTVAVCIVLHLLGVPGLWWAWSTMGLLILVVITVANLTKDRIGQVSAMLLSVMVMLLGMASWEMLYQTGLLFYHNFFGSGVVCYYIVMAEQLTWILPALIVILVLCKRYGNIVHANKATLVCVGTALVLTTIWFVDGMHIPLLWYQSADGIVGPFMNVDANPFMIAVSHGSQGSWLLGVVSLFTTKKETESVLAH